MDRSEKPGLTQEKVDQFFAEARLIPIGGNRRRLSRRSGLWAIQPKMRPTRLKTAINRFFAMKEDIFWPRCVKFICMRERKRREIVNAT
jgi:hypothetical protein